MINERISLQEQIKTWKQKLLDHSAKNELDKLQLRDFQKEEERTKHKLTRTVRALASEKAKAEIIAHSVANFCSRLGPVITSIDRIHDATSKLQSYEIRVHSLQDRIKVASLLLSHRHAWYRNNEAATEMKRRILNRQTLISPSPRPPCDDNNIEKRQRPGSKTQQIRHGLQKAVRAVFDELDIYKTGIISRESFVGALSSSDRVLLALGDDITRKRFAKRLDRQLAHLVDSKTVTWGELMLLLAPKYSDVLGLASERTAQSSISSTTAEVDERPLAPIFKVWKRAKLETLSKERLCDLIRSLQRDREMLRQRVQCDAFQLADRVQGLRSEWEAKVAALHIQNGFLRRELNQKTSASQKVEGQMMRLEDESARLHIKKQYYRDKFEHSVNEHRVLIEQVKADKEICVQHEQELWQKEVRDMTFQTHQIQLENEKHRKKIRQLEHEITRLHNNMTKVESKQVLELKNKLSRRINELEKIRKERNGILASLRELELNAKAPRTRNFQVQTEPLKLINVKIGSTQTTPVWQLSEASAPYDGCIKTATKSSQYIASDPEYEKLHRLETIAKALLDDN
ncbi:hypothetical protein ABG067_007736 [Albugo candida]